MVTNPRLLLSALNVLGNSVWFTSLREVALGEMCSKSMLGCAKNAPISMAAREHRGPMISTTCMVQRVKGGIHQTTDGFGDNITA